MRIREIEVILIELRSGEVSHIACGWVGCRNPDGAKVIASYKIRTGRTQAGMWQDRKMPLCGEHEKEFKHKYMSSLCPKCKKNPVDENSTRTSRIYDSNGALLSTSVICEWCPAW